jgi:excisionase family DNA binding protein
VDFANLVRSVEKRSKPAHPTLTNDDMLDAEEVAELLRMRLSTVFDFARRGILPGHKLGRRWIFLRDEIEASVREAPTRRAQPRTPAGVAAPTASPPHQAGRPRRANPSSDGAGQPPLFA